MFQNDAGPDVLGLLRIIVFGSWFIITLFFSPFSYSSLSLEIFEPWGAYRLIEKFPPSYLELLLSETSLTILKYLLLIGTLICALGVRPFHFFAILTMISLVYLDFVVRGFNGFINHAQLGIFYGAIIISFFPSSDGFSLFKKRTPENSMNKVNDYAFPVIFTGIVLTFAYSFIGINRIVHGGLEVFTNDALLIYIMKNSLLYSMYGFEIGISLIQYNTVILILKVGFFVVTIAEIVSPFIFFNYLIRRTWLLIIVPFHFITLFVMNIFFWENLLLISAIFIKWDQIFKKNTTL